MTLSFLLLGLLASNLTAWLGLVSRAAPWRRGLPFAGGLVAWCASPVWLDDSHGIATQPWHAAAVLAAVFTVAALPSLFLHMTVPDRH